MCSTDYLEVFSTPKAGEPILRSSNEINRLVDHTTSIIDAVTNNLQESQINLQPQNLNAMMNRTVSMMENLGNQEEVEEIGSEELQASTKDKENTPPAESGNFITQKSFKSLKSSKRSFIYL